MLFTRRAALQFLGTSAVAGLGLSSYAVAVEPRFRLSVTDYRLAPPRWSNSGRSLRIAVIADIHAVDPWMPVSRITEIVALTNSLGADLIVLLGDYVAGFHGFGSTIVPPVEWAGALANLSAPLGTYAILGNHDWWGDVEAVRAALVDIGIPVLENQTKLIEPEGAPAFWLAGLGDQQAFRLSHRSYRGVDDLPGMLSQIPDDGTPILLLAHEPDIFPQVPDRISLTLCGHTHGGQVLLPVIGRPVVPSAYGDRYAYGHFIEDERHMIVSAGLGCSWMPIRFGVPPEIVIVDVEPSPDSKATTI